MVFKSICTKNSWDKRFFEQQERKTSQKNKISIKFQLEKIFKNTMFNQLHRKTEFRLNFVHLNYEFGAKNE